MNFIMMMWVALLPQESGLAVRLRKGDCWIEHRRTEYVTPEGKAQRRTLLETEMEVTVETDLKDGEATLARVVRLFSLTLESPEGKTEVAYENGAWKKTVWGGLEAAAEHYREFVEHPPKLVGAPTGATRSVDEVEGETVGFSPHDPALLPNRRVKVGEEWKLAEESEGLTEFQVGVKLEAIEGGIAMLKMTMTLPERVESTAGEATVSGSIPIAVEVDLADGLIRSQKGSGEFLFTRADPAGGAPLKTRLQMSVHTTRRRK